LSVIDHYQRRCCCAHCLILLGQSNDSRQATVLTLYVDMSVA